MTTSSLSADQTFLEAVPDAALLVNRHGKIMAANSIVYALLEYMPGDLIGESVQKLVPEAVLERHEQHVQDYTANPARRRMGLAGILAARTKSGRDVPVDIMLTPLTLDGISFTSCMLRDMTQWQETETTLREAVDAAVEGWARAFEMRDEVAGGDTRRVTTLTLRLARALGVEASQMEDFRRGALLHDVGEMGLPDTILRKAGPLTSEEKSIVQNHPRYAEQFLVGIIRGRPAFDIPVYHHEHWDGTGYPDRLKGDAIPLAARIFAVADVYSAMTSRRPYQAPQTHDQACEHIVANSGRQFDPQVVEAFVSLKESFESLQ